VPRIALKYYYLSDETTGRFFLHGKTCPVVICGVSSLGPKRKLPNLRFWKVPEQKIPEWKKSAVLINS
jgi:hypothetical protein